MAIMPVFVPLVSRPAELTEPMVDHYRPTTARGAEFLNAVLNGPEWSLPTWRDRINPRYLHVASADCCVLGQLFGSYEDGLDKLGLGGDERRFRYGFTLEPSGMPGSFWHKFGSPGLDWPEVLELDTLAWNALTAAWRLELRA